MRFVVVGLIALVATATSSIAEAQSLGAFSWQLQPFCNRVTVTVVQTGTSYTLDGYDDQCGAAQRAPVNGVATLNPNGTIQFGFTTVVSGGLPVHVTAQVTLPSASGTWQDNLGNSGTFAIGGSAAGSPRPAPSPTSVPDGSITTAKLAAGAVDSTKLAAGAVDTTKIAANAVDATKVAAGAVTATKIASGAVGAAAINENEVQRRVSSACPTGQLMTAVNVDGTVTCAVDGAGTGDITGVTAGAGLSGGGASGDVSLAVAAGGITGTMIAPAAVGTAQIDAALVQRRVSGTCTAGSALRVVNQDGTVTCEAFGGAGDITAVVAGAGLTGGATSGDATLAVGFAGGGVATTAARTDFYALGTNNTAVGETSLAAIAAGQLNTAVGRAALQFTGAGDGNTAVGNFAARGNQTGSDNSALGASSFVDLISGSNNIAIGSGAGGVLESGSNNIYILADAATAAEANTLRLGSMLARAFISGIRGVTTDQNDAIAVVIDSNGQLGTLSSSRTTKDNIVDLGAVSRGILNLRPVQFTYKQPFAGGTTPVQYGLIAEEVAEVMPELVAHTKDGRIETVKYHLLPTLLLAEVQRLERERTTMAKDRDDLAARVAALERLVGELTALTKR
jgi:hypothetical protein